MLRTLGVEFGGPLLEPTPQQPRGRWEHRIIHGVNGQLMQAAGCDPEGLGSRRGLKTAALGLSAHAEAMAPVLTKFIQEHFQGGTWGFKDPRTSVTYLFWVQVFAHMGIRDVRPIVVVRAPEGSVRSLRRRGTRQRRRADAQAVLEVWSSYYALLEAHTPSDALWIQFEDLTDRQKLPSVLERCADYLELDHIEPLLAPARALLGQQAVGSTVHAGGPRLSSTIVEQYARLQERAWVATRRDKTSLAAPSSAEGAAESCYSVYVVSPPGYVHAQAFAEVATGLYHGLTELGLAAQLVTEPYEIEGTPIVLGAQLLVKPGTQALLTRLERCAGAILFNLEQVSPGSPWFSDAYLQLLSRHRVWDYSVRNQAVLQQLGLESVEVCQIGYHPRLRRFSLLPEAQRDVDVLFYGSLNDRRLHVLRGLERAGLRVVSLFGVYGEARDAWVQRSKVVLNLHYYPAQVFEIVRVSHLLVHGCSVVAEAGQGAQDYGSELADGLWLAAYEDLVATCRRAVADVTRRQAVAEVGQRWFCRRLQASYLAERVRPAPGPQRVVSSAVWT